jgi:hypothetical protein
LAKGDAVMQSGPGVRVALQQPVYRCGGEGGPAAAGLQLRG